MLEDDALNLRVGEHLARLAERVPGGIIYKASFDKANRSNAGAHRGPGLDEGLAALDRVRAATGLPILTDVHLPEQCAPAAEVVDVLQIPAFLCRQTDLLVAAGATGKPVNVKKGQWMHPEGMRGAVDKVRAATRRSGARRASRSPSPSAARFFGYGDLVVDMRGFARMRAACDAPVIFDATHSVQQPGQGEGGASGGAREFIPPLTLAACAAGADGLFMETHPDPDHAPSDGPNMIPLDELDDLVDARRRHLGPSVAMIDPELARSITPRRLRRRRRDDRRRHLPRRRRRQAGSSSSATRSRTASASHLLRRAGIPRRDRHRPRLGERAAARRGARRRRRRAGSATATSSPAFSSMLDGTASRRRKCAFVGDDFPDLPCCASSGCRSPSATPCRRSRAVVQAPAHAARRARRGARVRRAAAQGARRVGGVAWNRYVDERSPTSRRAARA